MKRPFVERANQACCHTITFRAQIDGFLGPPQHSLCGLETSHAIGRLVLGARPEHADEIPDHSQGNKPAADFPKKEVACIGKSERHEYEEIERGGVVRNIHHLSRWPRLNLMEFNTDAPDGQDGLTKPSGRYFTKPALCLKPCYAGDKEHHDGDKCEERYAGRAQYKKSNSGSEL
jgi:hypothetical protein